MGWTHYRILLGIGDPEQRRFYFERACAERWSKQEHTQLPNKTLLVERLKLYGRLLEEGAEALPQKGPLTPWHGIGYAGKALTI